MRALRLTAPIAYDSSRSRSNAKSDLLIAFEVHGRVSLSSATFHRVPCTVTGSIGRSETTSHEVPGVGIVAG
jgi:hypothetical protein